MIGILGPYKVGDPWAIYTKGRARRPYALRKVDTWGGVVRGSNGRFWRRRGDDLEEFGYETGKVADEVKSRGRVGPESWPPSYIVLSGDCRMGSNCSLRLMFL